MQIERLNLSQLNTPAPTEIPQRPQLPALNAFDSIRNNKTIEDTILQDQNALSNLDVATSLQRINDLEAQYDIVQSELTNVVSSVAQQAGARGISGIGVKNLAATRAAQLDEQRARLAAQISFLRGNVSTANALAARARAGASSELSYEEQRQAVVENLKNIQQAKYESNQETDRLIQADQILQSQTPEQAAEIAGKTANEVALEAGLTNRQRKKQIKEKEQADIQAAAGLPAYQ